ncbi:hypothetical protein [Legionella erythra]|uniref:Uncharacterized protein n=1 Tax=Legionella erythra TaxID=448 RepID=A0A0W0TRP0_LEGER|nr:hypothetical protein [Legionella erythra]KTC98174.1 hypothetical protein Lery_1228 [Legionella erythra]
MNKELIAQIGKIDFHKIKEGKSIHGLILDYQFEKAFYLACLHCTLDSHETLKFIKILILHQRELGIDLNLKKHPYSALRLAADNGNVNLYYELASAGAEDSEAERILGFKRRKAIASVEPYYCPEFLQGYTSLQGQDIDKFSTDAQRVIYILKLIDFLMKYHASESRFKKRPKHLSPLELQTINDKQDEQNRVLMHKLCEIIQKLSPEIRKKFDKSFESSALSWFSFEHLGGIMIEPSMQKAAMIQFSLEAIVGSDEEGANQLFASAMHFMAEVGDLQLTIPQAVLSIIEQDLPALRRFFLEMANALMTEKPWVALKLELPASQCLITYVNDIQNLIKLVNLTYNTNARIKIPVWPNPESPHFELVDLRSSFDVSKKLEMHAALRRLQILGELITGKNFSKFIIDLDPSTDWRAFIVIRDAITHQDERDLKYRMGQFLSDRVWLQQVFAKDLFEFGKKLNHLLLAREKTLGQYNYDPALYWQHRLKQEAIAVKQGNSNNNNPGKQEMDAATSSNAPKQALSADENEFIKCLITFKAPNEVIDLCVKLFSGQIETVSKLEKGAILKCLPRKELGDKYKTLGATLDKAIAKPALSLAERGQKRVEEKLASEKKEAEREARFKGLEGIRKLAKYLLEPVKKDQLLNPLKRIEAALESLSDIEEFLIKDGYWIPSLFLNTAAEWDSFHQRDGGMTLAARLVKSPSLNDALEYNIGQILQHLETIKTYKGLASCPLIANHYADLRSFRNYLEHGNPLVDNQNEIYQQQDYREKQTAEMAIRLLLELKPFLNQERIRIETERANAKDWHPGSLVTPKEDEEWTKVCGHGALFFSGSVSGSKKQNNKLSRMELPGDGPSRRSTN